MEMAEVNEKVRSMVEAELKKDPSTSNEDLYEKAIKIDPGVKDLSSRQFNARYPLQVKRKMSDAAGTSKPRTPRGPRKRKESNREEIRKELFTLAKDVAGTEDRGDLVAVMSNMDKYVDRVVEAATAK